MVKKRTRSSPAPEAAPAWTSGELSRLLDVDLKTIHNWVNHGHLEGRRTRGRHLRFDRPQVVRFLRQFDYPIPREVGTSPPRVLVESPRGARWSEAASMVRGSGAQVCLGSFEAALLLTPGEQEAVVFDLDHRDLDQLAEFVHALRASPLLSSLWLVGVGGTASSRRRFAEVGGDVTLPRLASGRRRELGALVRWLVGSRAQAPPSAQFRALDLPDP